MPTIVFATPKGGAGKSTSAILLATELALKGAEVTILDADDNQPISEWARLEGGVPDKITIVPNITEETILDAISDAAEATPFVIVDLEGSANMSQAYAMSRADLVIIPTQGSRLDAKEAAKAIKLVKIQEKAFKRVIPYAILFTRTPALIRPRSLTFTQGEFHKHSVPAFKTQINERDAFKAIFSFGGNLESLDASKVPNLDKAINNAREFASETVAMLKSLSNTEKKAKVVNG
jgi:chromosome partitioning protein